MQLSGDEDLASPAVSELETLLLLAYSAHPDSCPSCCSCSHFIDDGLRLRELIFLRSNDPGESMTQTE